MRKFALPVIESPPPEVTPAKPKFKLTVESPKQVRTTIIFLRIHARPRLTKIADIVENSTLGVIE